MTHPHLALTMGDPAGIGPEIIIKACEKLRSQIEASDLRLLIIGSGSALKSAAAQFGGETRLPRSARRRQGMAELVLSPSR